MSGLATAVGGAPVLGAIIGATGAIGSSLIGSSAQTSAGGQAINTQNQMFNQTQANLAPYMQSGNTANNFLMQGLGLSNPATQPSDTSAVQFIGNATPGGIANGTYFESNTPTNGYYQVYGPDGQVVALNKAAPNQSGSQQRPGSASAVSGAAPTLNSVLNSPLLQSPSANLSESALQQTPGYQFNLYQGEKATQNSAAARGLGLSGAAIKGADTYATGLADSTYQNQFNNEVTNQTNQFSRLSTLAGNGQNAAANLGSIGQTTANNIANTQMGIGNVQAGTAIAGGNALTSLANNYSSNSLLSNMQGGMYGQQIASNGASNADNAFMSNVLNY